MDNDLCGDLDKMREAWIMMVWQVTNPYSGEISVHVALFFSICFTIRARKSFHPCFPE